MTELIIELNKNNVVITMVDDVKIIDWIPALRGAAIEVSALNQFAAEGTSFPRPIEVNPDSETAEGFLGVVNTPPTADGMITVRTAQYDWINLGFLPQNPTAFSFILGVPPQAGRIL